MSTKTDTTNTIYHDLFIEASASRIFQAISEPEFLCNWWPLRCEGNPKVGETYNFYFGPDYDWYGEVVSYEKDKAFHIKMTKSDPDWDSTTFGFDLEPKQDQVHLQFWHKDWPHCNEHFRHSSFCWALLLNGLKNYVEKGLVIPFEERN